MSLTSLGTKYHGTILTGPRPAQIGTKLIMVNGQSYVVKVYESLQETVAASEEVADVRRVRTSHANRSTKRRSGRSRLK